MHEQRIEQLNGGSQVTAPGFSAHYASNNANEKRDSRGNFSQNNRGNSSSRGRGRGGRFGGKRLYCQLCTKPSHHAFQCYHRFDQNFVRPNPSNNVTNQPSGVQSQAGQAFIGQFVPNTNHTVSPQGSSYQDFQQQFNTYSL
ncbi:hypothetical protein ACOSQ3_020609 [Xanthoceras sorbifolium]